MGLLGFCKDCGVISHNCHSFLALQPLFTPDIFAYVTVDINLVLSWLLIKMKSY